MNWINDWPAHAACRGVDPDRLFVQGAAQNRAKAICAGCPVRTECLADSLDNQIEFGVWGGMTERERRALLRRRPDVASWRALLEDARTSHVQPVAASATVDVRDPHLPVSPAVVPTQAARTPSRLSA